MLEDGFPAVLIVSYRHLRVGGQESSDKARVRYSVWTVLIFSVIIMTPSNTDKYEMQPFLKNIIWFHDCRVCREQMSFLQVFVMSCTEDHKLKFT